MGPVILLLVLFFNGAYSVVQLELPDHRRAMNNQLYQEVLDPVLCEEQLAYLVNNNTLLLMQFLDAGIRVPKGILQGNLYDFGNYYQCLGINEEFPDWTIQGKHCAVNFPLDQNITLPELPTWPELPDNITWPEIPWPDLPWLELNSETSRIPEDVRKSISINTQLNRLASDSPFASFQLQLAVCVPQACTSKQFLDGLFTNLSSLGVEYNEVYCRLPNDKQWVAGDYVAISIFAFLGLLVFLSTCYDIHQTIVLRNDPKKLNKIYMSFSVYTNTRRLVTYTPVPGAVECLDGVRAFAMMWVIVGHTYVNQVSLPLANPTELTDWITTWKAIWITLGPITVDTFFMIGGLLLVYTTAGKFSSWKLIKSLHLFYLNRLLRMFPVLAAFVLIQSTFLHKTADGPNWTVVTSQTQNCRTYWWATLLHIQNWVTPNTLCLPHSWYLAIDVQLYILSPIVLFWVLGGKKTAAWTALIGAFLIVVAGSTVFSFLQNYQPWPAMPSRSPEDLQRFLNYFYFNTLSRASPFFVGMLYGYMMHLYRGQELHLTKTVTAILWGCAALIIAGIMFTTHSFMQYDWDNQIVDNFVNSFMRPVWAITIGWMVFACHHGYGGPINWVLSLRAWKVLGRLSYAMYIVHYTLIFLVDSTTLVPRYFSPTASLLKFLSDFGLAAVVAFILTLLVDSPFGTLIKLAMGGGQRRPRPLPSEETDRDKAKDLPNGIENAAFEADTSAKVRL